MAKDSIILSARQDSFFNTTRYDTSYLGYEVLKLPVQSIEYLSDVYLNIPELGDSTSFFLSNIVYRDSFIIWTGKSYNELSNGVLTLIQYKHYISGFIYLNDNNWELLPSNNNKILALKRKKSHDNYYRCAVSNNLEPDDNDELPDPCQIPPDGCYGLIRTLLEVTPPADSWIKLLYGNNIQFGVNISRWLFALKLEAEINIALKNSSIYNKFITIVAIDDLTSFPFNYSGVGNLIPNIEDDIDDLVNNSPFNADLSYYRCDIGIMLTDQNYLDYAGIANEIGPPDAFCGIIEVEYILGDLHPFTHEVGHILGARHHRLFDNTDICNHGWAVDEVDENAFIWTIMCYKLSEEDRYILNYSNPFVYYDGNRTGSGSNYNAAAVNNNGCYIADIQDDPYWSILITGLDSVCSETSENLSFIAEINEPGLAFSGFGPYKYIWQYGYSWNDINFPNLDWANQTDEGFFINIAYDPEQGNKELFVRLIVVSDDDYILISVKHVMLFPKGCEFNPIPEPWRPRSTLEETSTFLNCPLTSNFINSNGNLRVELNYPEIFQKSEKAINVIDLNGQSIYFQKLDNDASPILWQHNFKDISPGVYVLTVVTSCKAESFKFVKL